MLFSLHYSQQFSNVILLVYGQLSSQEKQQYIWKERLDIAPREHLKIHTKLFLKSAQILSTFVLKPVKYSYGKTIYTNVYIQKTISDYSIHHRVTYSGQHVSQNLSVSLGPRVRSYC